MPKNPVRSLLAAALVALFSAPASAALISVEVSTTLDAVTAVQTLPVMAGDAVVLRFSFEDTAEDVLLSDGSGQFVDNLTSISVEFPDDSLFFAWSGGESLLSTTDDAATVIPMGTVFSDAVDGGSVTGPVSGLLGGDVVDSMGFSFTQSTFTGIPPTLVVDDRLTVPFVFDSIGSTIFMQGSTGGTPYFASFDLAGGTGVVVPEPAHALLLMPGLAFLVGRRRPGGPLA